jgi:hypothetical protein
MIPLAAVIGAATAAGFGAEYRFHAAADRLARQLLQMVLWALMPVIAFFNIASLHVTASVGAGIGFGYVALAATLSAAYAIGTYLLRLPRAGVGALMCVAGLANTGYLGLPFTAALFGFDDVPNAVAYDVLVSGVTIVTVGFMIGAAFGDAGESVRERTASFFVRNPPLWASALGLIAPSVLAPTWAVDSTRVLVALILPIGFFAVGVTLAAEAEEGVAKFPPPINLPVAVAVALKLLLPPAIVFGLAKLIVDVPDPYFTQAAMPAGVTCVVIADTFKLDRGLTAAAIAWSTAIVVAAGLVAALL